MFITKDPDEFKSPVERAPTHVEINTQRLKDDLMKAMAGDTPRPRSIGHTIEEAIKNHSERVVQLTKVREKLGKAGLLDEPLELFHVY